MKDRQHIEAYRRFCEDGQLPVFYHPGWLDRAAGEGQWGFALLNDADGAIRAAWPYLRVRKWGMNALLNPRMTSYLGPVAAGPSEDEELTALYHRLPRHLLLEQKINPDAGISGTPVSKIQRIPSPTYLLNLKTEESRLLENMKESLRRQIRKAERNLEVTAGQPDELAMLFDAELRGKVGRNLLPLPQLTALLALLKGENGFLLAARASGQVLGGIAIVRNFRSYYYLIGAQNEKGREMAAMSGLMWEAIREVRRRGAPLFDFEGSSIPSIARFFSSFGAEIGVQISWRQAPRPVLRLLKKS